ncbi:non-specific lipid transfer protein GPI-anchored 11-like [Salvia hispanica]|uniref:non-specific lipid transfer protein GPI-anchored 11-like n=1 Tax=Salvia hispanica TaxID=49212 RepID=UPI002009D415|nr:non-specific lipid transfer protein GPI-anchored 11-like [Salvia hispanica]
MKHLSLIIAMWAAAAAAVVSGAATPGCSSLVFGMVDCMGFLAVGGPETAPRAACCAGFWNLVQTNADCVCDALATAANMGVVVDISRARDLPVYCGVATPAVTNCNVANTPNGSPEAAPLLPPASAISEPPSPTSDAPASAPAPAPSSSSSAGPAIFFSFIFFASALPFIIGNF